MMYDFKFWCLKCALLWNKFSRYKNKIFIRDFIIFIKLIIQRMMNFYSKIMLINKIFEVSPSDPEVLHQSWFAVLPSSQTSVPAQRVVSTRPDSVSKSEPLCFQKAYAFYLKEFFFLDWETHFWTRSFLVKGPQCDINQKRDQKIEQTSWPDHLRINMHVHNENYTKLFSLKHSIKNIRIYFIRNINTSN